MKKFMIPVISIFLSLFSVLPLSFAEGDSAKYTTFYIGKTEYYVNGQRFVMDASPKLFTYKGNSYTILPLRYVGEAMGLKMDYDDARSIAKFSGFDVENLEIDIKNGKVFADGEKYDVKVPPQVINNRVYLTIGDIAEIFGFSRQNQNNSDTDITWDGEDKSVTIKVEDENIRTEKKESKLTSIYANINNNLPSGNYLAGIIFTGNPGNYKNFYTGMEVKDIIKRPYADMEFLIIPRYTGSSLAVYSLTFNANTNKLNRDERIYFNPSVGFNDTFVIQMATPETLPYIEISVKHNDKEQTCRPYISGKDGSFMVNDGVTVLDDGTIIPDEYFCVIPYHS